MTLTAFLFPQLRTLKSSLDKSLKSRVSENPLASNMVNVPKPCWNLDQRSYIILIGRFQVNWVGMSHLFLCQILGLLVNTLSVDEKYVVFNRDNLTIPILMQLSGKQETFSGFLNSILNFKRFEKRDERHSFCISEITDSQNVVS